MGAGGARASLLTVPVSRQSVRRRGNAHSYALGDGTAPVVVFNTIHKACFSDSVTTGAGLSGSERNLNAGVRAAANKWNKRSILP